jgi:hypothetical protein
VGVKRKEYLLAAALAAVLTACPNPASPPANNPPTATFPSAGYLISGSLTPDATGVYASDGIFNGYLKYKQDSGTYALFRFEASDDSSKLHWGLDSSADSPINTTASDYYASIADIPPDSGWGAWAAGTGSTGTPVIQKLPISGKTTADGSTITAHYTFADLDGDAEGATTFQWYRFDDSTSTTGGIEIGTDLVSYTTDVADDGKYLRVEVTPVDEHGATGTPVLSPPVLIGTNNPPEAGFPTWDFEVQGAGTAAFNGGYVVQGTQVNGYPWYQQEGSSNVLFHFRAYDDGLLYWGIGSSTIDGYVWLNQVAYYSTPGTVTPPASGWATASGAGTAPTVTSSPFTGSSALGGTLTVNYTFTDPDGDAEGASTFQWYRSADGSSGWAAISGASSSSYTTVDPDDDGMYLRIEVTPVDEYGAVGTTVTSGPILVGSS